MRYGLISILFGIIFFSAIFTFFSSDVFAETDIISVESFDISYTIENGIVNSISLEQDLLELVIEMDTFEDGTFEITIPRELLDAKFESEDDVFFILVSGFETDYVELASNSQSRTLIIPFFGGDSKIEIIGTHVLEPTTKPEVIEIPQWVRNNAAWWADDLIEDNDFVSGIQYLIQKGIMVIPPTESGSSSERKIPQWIKNNAGWWAEGQIGDTDFVSGIQYLIEKGIMRV